MTDDRLDAYSEAGLDDEGEYEAMTAAQRRAAEREIARRNQNMRGRRGGGRAANRSIAPNLLGEDDDGDDDEVDGLVPIVKRRTRRDYDERRDIDDAAGMDDDVRIDRFILNKSLTADNSRSCQRRTSPL